MSEVSVETSSGTQKIKVTDEQVLTELRKLVEKEPNRTASRTYFPFGAKVHDRYNNVIKPLALVNPETAEGECIVGCLLLELGVKPADLLDFEGNSAEFVIPDLLDGVSPTLTSRLDGLQHHQDAGLNWQDASIAAGIFEPYDF